MKLDLKNSLKEGNDLLSNWKNKYSKTEYPEKIVLNIFYRKYTMDFMWDELNNSFQKKFLGGNKILWNDFNIGLQKLKTSYQQTAVAKTQPVLLNLLSKKTKNKVGNISYFDFKKQIEKAQNGSAKDLEELEYAYLYSRLADECVLIWSAFGGTGLNKIDAISKISGTIIEKKAINKYNEIEAILGQLCSAPYLEKNYNPATSKEEIIQKEGAEMMRFQQIASQLFNAGNYDGALDAFTKAINASKYAYDRSNYLNRGNTFMVLKRYDEAISDFNHPFLKDSEIGVQEKIIKYSNLGYSYFQLSDFKNSKKCYEKVQLLDRNDNDAKFMLDQINEYV
ncbi:hypothetical protein [Aequorivita sp. KMM 9714]|uniref:tetratricopeptide repeat protein n=1 Tax=Aequorivita sp. KMM 9714 TaxID=2707173 RepID=UPI0013ED2ECC|nr:hypothetical protein [Aequorivita sp. KMM 9714]NGX84405.1 hypothetical protein [Aequorivita sp. KMM 9714]